MNTIIEKLKAEIERMHQEAVISAVGNETEWLRSRIATCVDVLSFLSDLEKEEKPTTAEGLEEAVELDYTLEDGRIEIEGDPLPCLNPILNLPYPKFKPGQKVNLIIVKEEQK